MHLAQTFDVHRERLAKVWAVSHPGSSTIKHIVTAFIVADLFGMPPEDYSALRASPPGFE